MIECLYCQRPHNTQRITGNPLHLSCRRDAAGVLVLQFALMDLSPPSHEQSLLIIDSLFAAASAAAAAATAPSAEATGIPF